MAFCESCGAQLNEGARVCPSCGKVRAGAADVPPEGGHSSVSSSSLKTNQEIFQEQLHAKTQQAANLARAGGQAAHQAALATWQDAKTIGEKMVLVGAILGIVSFFLPWYSVSAFLVTASGSGFTLARQGRSVLWFFPIMMAVAVFLSWLHLHSDASKKILGARWLILIGAAWAWDWFTALISSDVTIGFGGYVAAVASFLVLIGGITQVRDQARVLSGSASAG
jgi:hypothetical protein